MDFLIHNNDHEIQAYFEYYTAIYTSIAVSWALGYYTPMQNVRTVLQGVGGTFRNAWRIPPPPPIMLLTPSLGCGLVRCGNHMRSVPWNTVVPRSGHHGFQEKTLTEKKWHMRCTFFCCEYERLMISGQELYDLYFLFIIYLFLFFFGGEGGG